MNTKKCEGCGWVYPLTYPELMCRFCGTMFKKRFCPDCGLYTDILPTRPVCAKCWSKRVMASTNPILHTATSLRHRAAVLKANEDAFSNWLSKIAKVPQFNALSQDEWIQVCSYFGKCAYCGKEEIAARVFFIPFAFGGRYAVWNVLPSCEKCATACRRQQNPFISLDKETTKRIVSYLGPILDKEICNETTT